MVINQHSAIALVIELLRKVNVRIESKNDLKKTIEYKMGETTKVINIPKEIEYAMLNGRANSLQVLCDSDDHFLNTPVSLGIINLPKGLNISLTSNYGTHSISTKGPALIEAPETSFSDEISFYRKEAVNSFNSEDLVSFSRNYRSFLQSSVSLVECFLHRYNFHIKEMVSDTSAYINTETLDSRASIEERLNAWMTTFAYHKMEDFKKSPSRSKFIELKNKRNSIVHPTEPSIVYDFKSIIRFLNYAPAIGDLLADLRKYAGSDENIGFIKQVRTEPTIKIINC